MAEAEPSEGGSSCHQWRARGVAALGVVTLLLLGLVGLRGSSGGAEPGSADRVLVVAVPGLRWQDLEAVDTPALDSLLGATAVLSVRAVGVGTDLVEGYLSFNSGNTLAPTWADRESAASISVDGIGCSAVLVDAARRGVDPLTGAAAGALGEALRVAGVERTVLGRPLALAGLMDSDGCVDRYSTPDDLAVGDGVTLIEFDGLDATTDVTERVEILRSIDRRLATLEVPSRTLVVIVAPSALDGAAEVTVVGVAAAGDDTSGSGLLRSPTTRRDGYLRSTDLAPTILEALGLAVPSSMNGTAATIVPSATELGARVAEHADLADRVRFRDRAITPVSVMVVAATVLAAAAAARRSVRWSGRLGAMAVALVLLSFLSGLTAYHHLALWVYLVLLVAAAGVVAVIAAGVVAWRPGGPTTIGVLCAVLWAVLVIDVVSGGPMQINTPLGYTPTVAGRFQGIGNLAFGLLASSCLVVAVGPSRWSSPRVSDRARWWWVVWVGALSVVVTALPRFGSDVGGTLALIPTIVVAAGIVSGRGLPRRRLAVALGASIGVVAMLGLLDRARPPADRTHLGRFVERLLDGEASIILERKLRANLELFTASIWPTVLVVLLAAVAALLWRRRTQVAHVLRPRLAERAFLGGLATVALLGVLLNDSGVAVPAVMLTVAVPWLASVLTRATEGGRL